MNVPFLQVLEPAIELAERGFPVSPVTASGWEAGLFQIKDQESEGSKAFYTADGKAPKVGQLQKNVDLATTFKSIAEHGALKGTSLTSPVLKFPYSIPSVLWNLMALDGIDTYQR